MRRATVRALPLMGRVAQLVEQGIENPRVGGSIPSPATITLPASLWLALTLGAASGCGDNCEQLCIGVRDAIAECDPQSLSWNDLGARGPINFVTECRDQWDRERLNLSAPELRRALQACGDARKQLELSCDEVLALYGPVD
jgi:hypothetical protein